MGEGRDRDPAIARFVLVGDCCSGIVGGPHERTFAAISKQIEALAPEPDFLCFLGDHIDGLTEDESTLREQWDHWLNVEFRWVKDRALRTYHLASNHITYSAMSRRVFRELFAELPWNGPGGSDAANYYVLRGELLLIFTDIGGAQQEAPEPTLDWIARILDLHRDVPFKLVLGHYPILPVNGYARYPMWRLEPRIGDAIWRLLKERRVLAYVCSHVIAYDARARDGVLQICSGGAGTRYGPTGDFMRGDSEFFHFLLCHLDGDGLRCRAIDEKGRPRGRLQWPLAKWANSAVQAPVRPKTRIPDNECRFRVAFKIDQTADDGRVTLPGRETLLCGFDDDEGPPTLWIGREQRQLVVEVVLWPGGPVGRWTCAFPTDHEGFAVEFIPEMGPGGVLIASAGGGYSSLSSYVAEGFDRVRWPGNWREGRGPSGSTDDPFPGQVAATLTVMDPVGREESGVARRSRAVTTELLHGP